MYIYYRFLAASWITFHSLTDFFFLFSLPFKYIDLFLKRLVFCALIGCRPCYSVCCGVFPAHNVFS